MNHPEHDSSASRIVKVAPDHLILSTSNIKMFYKEFDIPTQYIPLLARRKTLCHPALLTLYEFAPVPLRERVGLYLGYYITDLALKLRTGIRQTNLIRFDDEALCNTFEPIMEVIDYLYANNYPVPLLQPQHIVVDEQGEVKFVEAWLLGSELQPLKPNNSSTEPNKRAVPGVQTDPAAQYSRLLHILLYTADRVGSIQQEGALRSNFRQRIRKIKANCSQQFSALLNKLVEKTQARQIVTVPRPKKPIRKPTNPTPKSDPTIRIKNGDNLSNCVYSNKGPVSEAQEGDELCKNKKRLIKDRQISTAGGLRENSENNNSSMNLLNCDRENYLGAVGESTTIAC